MVQVVLTLQLPTNAIECFRLLCWTKRFQSHKFMNEILRWPFKNSAIEQCFRMMLFITLYMKQGGSNF